MSKKVKLKSVERVQNTAGRSRTKQSQAGLRKAEEKAKAAEELKRQKAEFEERVKAQLIEDQKNPKPNPVPAEQAAPAPAPAPEPKPAPEPTVEPAPEPQVEDNEAIAADDISAEATERRLRRLSLATLQRYAKQSAKGADKAIVDSAELDSEYNKVLDDIKAAKTPNNATDAERQEYNKKRAELRKERDTIAKKKAIADNKAVSLERAADEYAYIVSLLSKNPPVDYRKQPRINPMNVDLTEEEKAELIARYYNTGKYNTKVSPKAKPAVEAKEAVPEVEKPAVENSETEEPSDAKVEEPVTVIAEEKVEEPAASETPAEEQIPEEAAREDEAVNVTVENDEPSSEEDDNDGRKKWFLLPLILLLIILALLFMKCSGDKKESAPAKAPEAVAVPVVKEAETPAPVKVEETPQVAKVEAPAPAPAPETPAPAPVEEIKEPVVEEVKEDRIDKFFFTRNATIGDAYDFSFEVANGRAVMHYPKSVSDKYAADLLAEEAKAFEPQYGSYYPYATVEKVGGGEVVITYPDYVDEPTLDYAVDIIIDELTRLIEAETQAAEADEYYFSTALDIGNDYIEADVYRGHLTAIVPGYIKYDDAVAFAKVLVGNHPGVFDDVIVEVHDDNSAVFHYSESLTEDDICAGLDLIQKELDLYLAKLAAKNTEKKVVKKSFSISIQIVAKQSSDFFTRTESLYGYDLTFDVAKGKAKVAYPAFITDAEIVDFITSRAPKYAGYTDGVSIGKLSDGQLKVTYPEECTADDLNIAIDVLIAEINAYVADLIQATEASAVAEAEAAAVAEVEAVAVAPTKLEFAFTRTIDVNEVGLSGTIEADKGTALVTYPAVIYQSDIDAYVAAVLSDFPGAYNLVKYEQVGEGQVRLYYSEEFTAEEVNEAIDYLEAKIYEMLRAESAVKEEPVVEAAPAKTEEPAIEAVPAKAEEPVEKAEEPIQKTEEPAKVAEPAAAPVAPKAKERKSRCLVSLEGGAFRSDEFSRVLVSGGLGIAMENIKGSPVDIVLNFGGFGGPTMGISDFIKSELDKCYRFSTYDKGFFVETLIGTNIDKGKATLSFAAGPRIALGAQGKLVKDGNKDFLRDGYTLDYGITGQAGVRYMLNEKFGVGLKGFVNYMFESEDFQFGAKVSGVCKF